MSERKNNVLPPYTNRGAERTGQSGLRALVDWVQATLKNVHDPHDVMDILGINRDNFTFFPVGSYGYKSHYRFGHIAIYFDGRDDMGIHIEMSGQGCREFEEFTKKDWSTFFALLLNFGVNFTRLDVSIDDFSGYISLDKINEKIKRGHVVSRFQEAREHNKYALKDGSNTGKTISFGSPTSRIQIVFYDKFLERTSKGKEIEEGIEFWNRIECRLRKDRANEAAMILAFEHYNTGQLVMGILQNYIRFVVPNKNDTNKRRWKTCQWWDDFLHGVERLQLSKKAPDATIERAKSWVEYQVAPTLAMLYEAFNHDEDMLFEFIMEGLPRLTDKHRNMIERYKEEQKHLKLVREQAFEVARNKILSLEKDNVKRKEKRLNSIDESSLSE